MSPAELDVPHSSDHIRGMEFGTIRRRGYDPEQVRDYLERVATRVATLELELRQARLHAAPPAQVAPEQGPADDPYERLAARFAQALRTSDEQAE
jgi:DivIVA domain-containing protein